MAPKIIPVTIAFSNHGHLVWGNVSTQFGTRGSDSTAAGFTDEVTQVVVGADLLSRGAARLGVGFAHTSDSVSDGTQSGTAQDNTGFIYGQMPLGGFEIQGIGSYGATSTNSQRPDPLGGTLIKADDVGGTDALVSLGVSRPFLVHQLRLAPYARVTWQQVSQAAFTENTSSAAALSVDSFAGTGVRTMIGLTAGSTVMDPLAAAATYKLDLGGALWHIRAKLKSGGAPASGPHKARRRPTRCRRSIQRPRG
jgi:outer membrane autotransporter protein